MSSNKRLNADDVDRDFNKRLKPYDEMMQKALAHFFHATLIRDFDRDATNEPGGFVITGRYTWDDDLPVDLDALRKVATEYTDKRNLEGMCFTFDLLDVKATQFSSNEIDVDARFKIVESSPSGPGIFNGGADGIVLRETTKRERQKMENVKRFLEDHFDEHAQSVRDTKDFEIILPFHNDYVESAVDEFLHERNKTATHFHFTWETTGVNANAEWTNMLITIVELPK